MRKTMIVPRLRTLVVIAAALASIALVLVANGNSAVAFTSLNNGNFETGNLSTGWTVDTTKSGETASAVTSYAVPDPFSGCQVECYQPDLSALPHEGSYFALLKVADQSEYTTLISQPFNASNGDRVSGWVFTLETLYQAKGYTTDGGSYGFDDKGEVVLTGGSGTTLATLFKDSGSRGDYDSPWRYWEYNFTDLPGEGQFRIQAKQSSQMWSGDAIGGGWEPNVLGLDDVKISTLGPDTTKPATSATRSIEPNAAGWNKENVTVKLKATDNQGGWGVKELTYRINGGQPTTEVGYSVEVPVTAEGENTISYYATDKALNSEDEQSLQVKIDKTPPRVDSDSASPADNTSGVSPSAKISVSFLEGGSGIRPSTLTPYGFEVYKATRFTGTERVSGTISYDAASKRATFTPSQRLGKGTYYAGINSGYIKDRADNVLFNGYDWSFSVG